MLPRHTLIPVFGLFVAAAMGLFIAELQAAQQSQEPVSVAEAARRAREQKANAPATGKVFTNDNLGEVSGTVSVVGSTPPAPAESAEGAAAPGATPEGEAAATGETAAPAATEERGEASWRQRFAEARRVLALDERELDVLQREYNLKQQQFYTDPNVALREQYNRQDLNETLEQLNAKREDVERDRRAITALEDELRRAGGNAAWAREP